MVDALHACVVRIDAGGFTLPSLSSLQHWILWKLSAPHSVVSKTHGSAAPSVWVHGGKLSASAQAHVPARPGAASATHSSFMAFGCEPVNDGPSSSYSLLSDVMPVVS